MRRGVIDRFEGDIAVIETDEATIDVPKSKLPRGAKSGDTVIIEGDTFRIDADDTKKRKREIESLMDELFE
ncbi:DUF3006 domain-containing protein [Paenibacillus mendelii]|uniref:DUF3006 domain-containing protein n=1 Tax=Paenibacillus mendelii TaxID=206163 RepID=A0ABV6JDM1_9BACL|nr:DUF3006 domain-containing protein [Paenibacillus mendelii]MCQ6563487.1 DUF3006 domain-containing protein [Paenibacillus mendelii]